MRWDSFRVRLTLWNMAVLALVLGGFWLAFCYRIQSWMSWSIDRDLAERAHQPFFGRFHSHDRFRGAPGPPGSGPRGWFIGPPSPPGGGPDPFHRPGMPAGPP